MMDFLKTPAGQTLLKLAVRRGLSALGGAAASISDDQLTQAAGVALVIGNELWQAALSYRAHRRERDAQPAAK